MLSEGHAPCWIKEIPLQTEGITKRITGALQENSCLATNHGSHLNLSSQCQMFKTDNYLLKTILKLIMTVYCETPPPVSLVPVYWFIGICGKSLVFTVRWPSHFSVLVHPSFWKVFLWQQQYVIGLTAALNVLVFALSSILFVCNSSIVSKICSIVQMWFLFPFVCRLVF